jgi:hypothetical protein
MIKQSFIFKNWLKIHYKKMTIFNKNIKLKYHIKIIEHFYKSPIGKSTESPQTPPMMTSLKN